MTQSQPQIEALPLAAEPLKPDQLYRRADLSGLSFGTTTDLQPVDAMAGQGRALDAVRLGAEIRANGFNVCVIGAEGATLQKAIKALLSERTPDSQRRPSDWIYVNNFSQPHRPIAIELPGCRAPQVREVIHELIEDLKTALPAAFESSEFQTRRRGIDEAAQNAQESAFTTLREKANAQNVGILRTPMGFVLVPFRHGKVIPPDEVASWPEEEKKAAQAEMEKIAPELEQTLRSLPRWEKRRRDEIRRLERETVQFAVGHTIEEAKAHLADLPRVLEHLESIRRDLIENAQLFIAPSSEEEVDQARSTLGGPFNRYEVNILVSQSVEQKNALIVEEAHPTLSNLCGRIEHISHQGTLVTNFTLIRAGSLHRANGGYLLIDLRTLLLEPFSWAALKRALHQRQITIEDIAHFIGLTTTVSLEPDPIPLDLKVFVFSDRLLYYLLAQLDPEFERHFKVLVDFDDDIDRSPSSEAIVARLIASIIREHNLLPFDRKAVERVVEHAARLAEDSGKLSLLVEKIRDVIVEAAFTASREGQSVVSGRDVEQSVDQQIRRVSRFHDRSKEAILRGVALIDTDGMRIGQINGVSVINLSGFSFGMPTRITCRAHPGFGKIIDIEREVELGGPLHSKGILILAGFLTGRYALHAPMSLAASLVFEQSYSGVEGDSASSAELYALLSAIAEVPLRQDLAVTGSVNQHGQIQAVGGVNQKIEGFFDICNARGLTGKQGVLIPKANVQHLMLRRDVVEACAARRFAIFPLETIDDGIALLSGKPAGERDQSGVYPPGSVNRLVEDRLTAFVSARRAAAAERPPDALEGE